MEEALCSVPEQSSQRSVPSSLGEPLANHGARHGASLFTDTSSLRSRQFLHEIYARVSAYTTNRSYSSINIRFHILFKTNGWLGNCCMLLGWIRLLGSDLLAYAVHFETIVDVQRFHV